jgi:Phosphate-selective porin O and P
LFHFKFFQFMFSPINPCRWTNPVIKSLSLVAVLALSATMSFAQVTDTIKQDTIPSAPKPADPLPTQEKKSHWYDKISLRGYVQVRYGRLLETNSALRLPQDASVGGNSGFLIRRARLVFSGNVHDRVYIYIQPDLASSASGVLHYAQLRDAYFDLALDKQKEFRLRVGQSKVPYGFENLQSSQNRLTLDRNEGLNSAVPNERDLGVFFYWAPDKIRKRFSELVSTGLKGSGDYGVFGLGVYNGQTANRAETNDNLTVVARLSYPLALPNGQIIEPGIQGYAGKFNVDQVNNGVKGGTFTDERVAGSLVVYPQPFGFQAEYNVGTGAAFDPATLSIRNKSLSGGYAQTMYLLKLGSQTLIPFAKVQYFEGSRKGDIDARLHRVYETEIGVEWQPIPAFELVTQYNISDRTTKDARNLNNHQIGNVLRFQAQFNF